MGKKVSVVIPVYNSSKYVLDTIKSVVDQDYEDIEIMVVNDGSTDDSLGKIESKYGGVVKVINIDNSGVSNARNVGIMESKGEYIAFIDSDDLWESDKISRQILCLESNENIGVSYTSRYIICSDGTIINDSRKRYSGNIFNKILVRNFVCLSSVIVKRECFDNCGVFDTSLSVSEDYDLWIRIASRYDFFYVDKPLVYYRITPGSLTKNTKNMIMNAHYVFLKNTLDVNMVNNVNFFTYLMFYSDTFKTTGHTFYDIKNYRSAMKFFCLSFLVWPFRLETGTMLIKTFIKKIIN